MNKSIGNKAFRKAFLFSRKQAFYASVSISLLLNVVLIIGLLYGRSHQISIPWTDYLIYFFWHFGCNLILFYLLFLFNFRMIKKKPAKRSVFSTFLGTILICLFISPILSRLQWAILAPKADFDFGEFAVLNMVKDMILSFIVIAVTYIFYLYFKREQALIANHTLMQENIRVKYESLKNQLDPHFLFNSLNTLSGLVGVDDNKAQDYIDNLSSVFRYTLYSKKVCTLEEELEFVDAYFTLMRIRYGSNLKLVCNIAPACNEYLVIPVSLQLLIENAIKHNVISNSEPLTITIETSGDAYVTVSNAINPKVNKSVGGVGLVNLTERYSILFDKTVEIKEQEGVFYVTIPLIKEIRKSLIHESSYHRR